MPPSPIDKLKALAKKKKPARQPSFEERAADHDDFKDWTANERELWLARSVGLPQNVRIKSPSPPARPDDEEENDVAIESGSDNEAPSMMYKKPRAARSGPLQMATEGTSSRSRQASASSTRSSSPVTASSSPDLLRRISSTLPTIAERPVTPPSGPRYIHRKHTAKGTQWSLHSRSPSGGTPNTEGSSIGRANRDRSLSVDREGLQDVETPDRFPEQATPEEIDMSRSMVFRKGRLVRTSSDKSLPNTTARGSLASKGQHKRSRDRVLQGNEEEFADPNDSSDRNIAFASSRHAPTEGKSSKATELRKKRLPTVVPGPEIQSRPRSTHADTLLALTGEGPPLSPARPSFEPSTITPEDHHVYRQLRLGFAHSMIFERAGAMLTSLYKDPDWPADVPKVLTAEQHSSIVWAREASKLFRSQAQTHQVYRKFHENGNDILFRAKNDLVETNGDMGEIRERVDDWENVDQAEGVQEIKLVKGSG
ncbi:hypothetical protein LTR09_012313 [Extremus antarcticus]|uniref:Uncharacterized protein n=1 Tax=Extremus antarcticus TaxID=702011 RepID=A0AAJ0G6X0_9PEZI|nr:hypothetical protein LTR09_012313 [Extremus antarcticus]